MPRRLQVIDIIIDVESRKAVVDAINHCTTASREGSKLYPFEHIFTLSMTDDGLKIKKIMQFGDTGMADKLLKDQAELERHLQDEQFATVNTDKVNA